MSYTGSHPRRTLASPPPLLINSLRKSDTFSARTGLRSDLYNPRENPSFRPQRSPTSLDESFVINQAQLAATRQELVDKYLKDVDDALQGDSSDASLNFLNNQQVLAVPSAVADQIIIPEDLMDVDEKKNPAEHLHCSDSGLGSSVDTPQQGTESHRKLTHSTMLANPPKDTRTLASALSGATSATTVHSAITKSFSAESINSQNTGPALSADGLKHIQENILDPLLANLSLKEFHPLITAVPSQAQAKIISNLRDLEKQFLYGAPVSAKTYLSACAVAYYHGRNVKRFSSSPKSFLKFWEFSIQCLHTTVDFLTERDQKRPSDRPYTNNYFLDLVEQINRYAAIMRHTREKEERGENTDEMDYSPYDLTPACTPAHSPCQMTHGNSLSHRECTYNPSLSHSSCSSLMAKQITNSCLHCCSDEQITIEGGLSTNGRPAELVRKKNGKSIALVPEEARSEMDGIMTSKRPFDDDEFDSDDDDVLRSMARRRKSDKAGDVMHVCSDCKKEFKRPCDLTKHEKTHSRPFKCSEPSCRYHDLGWPTEKERDRHVNDKHSSAPKMYHCTYKPCSYSSKRESNCKQHMEKAHGWNYIRSKSNGRKRATTESGSVSLTPSTPHTPFDATPGYTPESNFAPSPFWPANQQFGESSRSSMHMYPNSARRDSVTTANTNFTYSSGFSPNVFDAPPEELDFKSPVNYTPANYDFNSPQLFTPAMDFTTQTMPSYTPQFDVPQFESQAMSAAEFGYSLPTLAMPITQPAPVQQPSHFSPTGQGDVTLFSTEVDEGYSGADGMLEDFVLFPTDSTMDTSNTAVNNWTLDTSMTNFGGQFDAFYDQPTMFPQ